jgi:hypothetical protein
MKKALTTLNKEFEIAVSRKNHTYAKEVVNTTKKLYDDFSSAYRESSDYGETMSFIQKSFAIKMRSFISYLIKRMKTKFGGNEKYEQEIEQAIE